MITINSRKKPLSSGTYGRYFRLSRTRGVKVLGFGYKKIETMFSRFKTLDLVEKEIELLQKAQKSNLSPKYAKLVVVKYKGKFYPAIKMQHIGGKIVYDIDKYIKLSKLFVNKYGKRSDHGLSVKKFILNKLKKAGITHKDLHCGNVMINSRREIKVIDFTPEWIGNVSK